MCISIRTEIKGKSSNKARSRLNIIVRISNVLLFKGHGYFEVRRYSVFDFKNDFFQRDVIMGAFNGFFATFLRLHNWGGRGVVHITTVCFINIVDITARRHLKEFCEYT